MKEVSEREIAQQLIRLPNSVTPNIAKSIDKLESLTEQYYHNWHNSSWLRGMIALPLDEHLKTKFNNWKIGYSQELGLTYKKDGEDE